jgi:hypothetical protein
MATAEIEGSTTEAEALIAPAGPLRRAWQKIATVLAVIGLVDLSSQLIKWAALIHWIAETYAAVRAWLFGWLHLPPEWHDPIVLLLILFSVTNVGLYRRTQHTFIFYLRKGFWLFWINDRDYVKNRPVAAALEVAVSWTALIVASVFIYFIEYPHQPSSVAFFFIGFLMTFIVTPIAIPLIMAMSEVISLAWRWLLTTAAIFGALVIVNQVYALWLEPLVEHR